MWNIFCAVLEFWCMGCKRQDFSCRVLLGYPLKEETQNHPVQDTSSSSQLWNTPLFVKTSARQGSKWYLSLDMFNKKPQLLGMGDIGGDIWGDMCLENREKEQKCGSRHCWRCIWRCLPGKKYALWERWDIPNRTVACKQPMLELEALNEDCLPWRGLCRSKYTPEGAAAYVRPMLQQIHPQRDYCLWRTHSRGGTPLKRLQHEENPLWCMNTPKGIMACERDHRNPQRSRGVGKNRWEKLK